jgi:hypothetical protein
MSSASRGSVIFVHRTLDMTQSRLLIPLRDNIAMGVRGLLRGAVNLSILEESVMVLVVAGVLRTCFTNWLLPSFQSTLILFLVRPPSVA